ncbi:MAG: hypothetical protein HQM12_13035 [SAR324 cluster bacterium]|nr:hypothetical protein [SAR324 cluster bacterium]
MKQTLRHIMMAVMVYLPLIANTVYAQNFTQSDRDLLIRMDERMNSMEKRLDSMDKRLDSMDKRIDDLRDDMNKRFEMVDKRFEELRSDTNKRFETIDKRFEEFNQRFDQQNNLLIGIVTAFAGIVAVSITFALWDRRTMIRPFETKVAQLEQDLKKIPKLEENLAQNQQQLHRLLESLRALSKTDGKVAEILKSYSLL